MHCVAQQTKWQKSWMQKKDECFCVFSITKKMMKQRPTVSLVKRKCQSCCGVNKLALLSSYLGGETHPRPHQTTRLRFLSELHIANIFSRGFMCLVASLSTAYGNLMSHLFTLCSVVLNPPGFNMPHTVHTHTVYIHTVLIVLIV